MGGAGKRGFSLTRKRTLPKYALLKAQTFSSGSRCAPLTLTLHLPRAFKFGIGTIFFILCYHGLRLGGGNQEVRAAATGEIF